MAQYLTHSEMWKAIWPTAIEALIVVLVIASVLWAFGYFRADRQGWLSALFAFSMLGLVTGIMAGLSRQPAVAAILPPVLSLVGALAIYLVGKDSNNRVLVSLCVLVLAFNLLIGANWGGT